MKPSFPSAAPLLYLLLLLHNHITCEASNFKKPLTNVTVINNIPGGVDLTIHCKSKDDDLGFQTILPGLSWSFDFRPDIFCRTLFFCSVQWPDVNPVYTVIYDCRRDHQRCSEYTWSITPESPCLFNSETKKFDQCEKWNPPL